MEGSAKYSGAINFLSIIGRLKSIRRTGWVVHGVSDPECVAGHMYRMGVMSLLALDELDETTELEDRTNSLVPLDAARCMRIALVHDMAEAIVGDITPYDDVSVEDKHAQEAAAIDALCLLLTRWPRACASIREAYAEYEDNQTAEARFVKDSDKLDMVLQAHEYECAEPRLDLSDFFISTKGKFKTRFGQQLAAEIVARREATNSTGNNGTQQRRAIKRALRQVAHWTWRILPYAASFAAGAAAAVALNQSLRIRRL